MGKYRAPFPAAVLHAAVGRLAGSTGSERRTRRDRKWRHRLGHDGGALPAALVPIRPGASPSRPAMGVGGGGLGAIDDRVQLRPCEWAEPGKLDGDPFSLGSVACAPPTLCP
jgi:hypothetical protein